jgi:hypothetical protein
VTILSGTSTSVLIEFPFGPPDGNSITWTLRDADGTVITGGSPTVPADAVSTNIFIPGNLNTLVGSTITTYRDLDWSYLVDGAVMNGSHRYDIQIRLPFGVSYEGVRAKLAASADDLPDDQIPLLRAYVDFRGTVTAPILTAAILGDPYNLIVRDAIEALAARALIATMVVRIAKTEDSGTSKFQRQDIDWAAVAAMLDGMISDGIIALVPGFDLTLGFGALFILAGPATDAFTGV